MATLTVASAIRTGTGVDMTGAAAAGGGDAFANSGQEVLFVTLGGSACTVTIVTQATSDSQTVAALAVVCPINKTTAIGPFPQAIYNDANGLVQITYSAVTAVTVKALKTTPA